MLRAAVLLGVGLCLAWCCVAGRATATTARDGEALTRLQVGAVVDVWIERAARDELELFVGSQAVQAVLQLARRCEQSGNLTRAHELLAAAVALAPAHVGARLAFGEFLEQHMHRYADAVQQYDAALRLQPDLAHAFFLRGIALQSMPNAGQRAIESYKHAVALQPDAYATIGYANMAMVLWANQRHDEALHTIDEALRLDPAYPDAYNYKGIVLMSLGRYADAVSVLEDGLRRDSNNALLAMNLANANGALDRIESAAQLFLRALQLNPALDNAFFQYTHATSMMCEWAPYDELMAEAQRRMIAVLNRNELPELTVLNALVFPWPPSLLTRLASAHAAHVLRSLDATQLLHGALSSARITQRGRRVRLGFLSHSFGESVVSYVVHGWLGRHRRDRFEVFAFSTAPLSQTSDLRAEIQRSVDQFVDLSRVNDVEAAQLISRLEIDILVTLDGWSKGARTKILAYHPAPIAINAIGFSASTGAPFIDLMLTDAVSSPPCYARDYTERLVYVPTTYFGNTHAEHFARFDVDDPRLGRAVTRSHVGLPDGKFVFACFNHLYKIDPATFRVWLEVLRAVPDSVLWLLRYPMEAESRLRRYAEAAGIAAERLVFSDRFPLQHHIEIKSLADLYLDTPAYGSHATALDVLWAGVPILTLRGRKMVSRIPTSLSHAAGLSLVARTLDEYRDMAIQLASQRQYLAALRNNLWHSRRESTLFRTDKWLVGYQRALMVAVDATLAGRRMHHVVGATPRAS